MAAASPPSAGATWWARWPSCSPIGSGRRNATVTAVTDAEIYAGSPAEFRSILEASPSVAKKVHELD